MPALRRQRCRRSWRRFGPQKYQDPVAAVHDGYFSTLGCVEYPSGGMGIHFLNLRLISPTPDPMAPSILLYEPVGDKLRFLEQPAKTVPQPSR